MISEISLAMTNNLTIDKIAKTIHPHPTLSEIIHECSLELSNIGIFKNDQQKKNV